MALDNEINVGRYNRFLQKLLSMKGKPPAPQLASEISTSISFFSGVENRYLESWDRFAAAFFLAAVAANQDGVRIRNPVGSNVILVLERIELSELLSDNVGLALGTATTDLAVTSTGGSIDFRGRPLPSAITSTQTTTPTIPALTGAFTLARPFIAANTPYFFVYDENQEINLGPGQALQINTNTVNQGLSVALLWRERALEESELR